MGAYDRFIAELTAKRYFDWRGFLRYCAVITIAVLIGKLLWPSA